MTDTLPPPLVDLVPTLNWFELQEGPTAVLQNVIDITAPGTSTLPVSAATFNTVHVNAAGAVTMRWAAGSVTTPGQRYQFKDDSGHADTNPITIADSLNAALIDGASAFILNIPFGSCTLEWNGTGWSLEV